MNSQINEILKKIASLQKELLSEYEELLQKYGYQFEKNKIVFLEQFKDKNRKLKQNAIAYLFTADFKHLLSIPFIYSVFIPMLILDLFLWVYQTFAFPLYGIPKVKRSEYIVFDRQFLDYLNFIQKLNCMYCSYGNGLFIYAAEIAARTERYWCPIKAAKSPKHLHQYYQHFADFGDAQGFNETFNKTEGIDIQKDDSKKSPQ